jgi:hypothetical protein
LKNPCDFSQADHHSDKLTQLATARAKRMLMNAIRIRLMDELFPKPGPVIPHPKLEIKLYRLIYPGFQALYLQ